MVASPKAKTLWAAGPDGFIAEGLPEGPQWGHPIHHDTPKAFTHIFILSSSRTSKEGSVFPVVSLGTPLGNRKGMKPSPLVELNPNMLVRDVESMDTGGHVQCLVYTV